MNPEKTKAKVFSRRAALIMGGQTLVMGGLGARLYYLQVLESERYAMLAEENRINFRLIGPPRGFIVDRNGDYLAINVQNYRVVLVREQAQAAGGVEAVLEKLARLIDLQDHTIARVLKEAQSRLAFVPITVAENLSWQDVSRIGVNQPDLPGVSIDVGQIRHYPYAENMAHVVGYVAAVSEKELTGDPLLELPGFRVGKNGIEKHYDLALRGTSGTSKVEVNALGRVIREIDRQEGQPGREVRLTLDMRLQDFAGQRLSKEKAASVVVMDVHSGDVLALVSVPSYDPNAFSEGIGATEWQNLVKNPYGPLTNKAIAGQYSPGSTFKVAVALAALENGIAADHSVYCPGYMVLGDRRFHCWKHYGHGHMDMVTALEQSCDVWFYDVARRVGVDRIAEVCNRLGLGIPTEIELLGERAGLIPTRKWKREDRGQPWHMGETLVVGIGQGFVLTTPLQLAVMTSRIVNGGKAVRPRLTFPVPGFDLDGKPLSDEAQLDAVKSEEMSPEQKLAAVTEAAGSVHAVSDVTHPTFPNAGFHPDHLAIVRRGMDAVVNGVHGTARSSALRVADITMGGKTGTSQVRRISQAERDAGIRSGEDIAWRLRDHALFVGFAPVHEPRYAVSVVVEHAEGGSRAAAPIARDLLEEILRLQGFATAEAKPKESGSGGAG
ncbi:MAG: penicillin-binding protein 2 [Alphaproteobacteria bacterium]|nr:penicillin-binding protein 2 [Alphaproteobacteria bacterium]